MTPSSTFQQAKRLHNSFVVLNTSYFIENILLILQAWIRCWRNLQTGQSCYQWANQNGLCWPVYTTGNKVSTASTFSPLVSCVTTIQALSIVPDYSWFYFSILFSQFTTVVDPSVKDFNVYPWRNQSSKADFVTEEFWSQQRNWYHLII